MHYKNGREAKAGDKVVHLDPYGEVNTGLIFDLKPGSDTCNAMIAPVTTVHLVSVGQCLHVDDLRGMQFGMANQPAQNAASIAV
jgi:hypothetical protein